MHRVTCVAAMTTIASLSLAAGAGADGYRMKDGRYASGVVTVIKLTRLQMLTARTSRVLVLDQSQKDLLRRESGKAPTVLYIHSLKVAGKDCTCGQYNFAIWFKPDAIEVPHSNLATDDEAAQAKEAEESGASEY